MDINHVRELQGKLEIAVEHLISEFEGSTGCTVEDIYIDRGQRYGSAAQRVMGLNIKVTL